MMSRYRARAESMEDAIFIKNQNQHNILKSYPPAKTYSSGEMEYLWLPPIIICVSYTR